MRVVTYARVSTLGQETKGQSLENQERAFTGWLERTGNTRARAYREAASAGSTARAEFQQMLADLPRLRPDAVVVDTIDRFTRNLRDGLDLLEQLRGHGVGLLPIDWRRAEPVNVDDDRDWADVVDEFTSAEKERRKIRRRVQRAYEGRRERGVYTGNHPPLGLRRDGYLLVPDRDTGWIMAEAEKRYVAGEDMATTVRWMLSVEPRAWRTRSGFRRALANEWYVRAGARAPEMHHAIAARLEIDRARFGQRRVNEHEFTGVFACGACMDAGFGERASLMGGVVQHVGVRLRNPAANIACVRREPNGARRTPAIDRERVEDRRHAFQVATSKLRPAWDALIARLTLPETIDSLATADAEDAVRRERGLTRRLASLDQQAAALKARRDAAFDLLADRTAGVIAQARKMLAEVESDEQALGVSREAVLGDLAARPGGGADVGALRALMARYVEVYADATPGERNRLNRALCAAVGSHPQVRRLGSKRADPIAVVWPALAALRSVALSRSAPRPYSRR